MKKETKSALFVGSMAVQEEPNGKDKVISVPAHIILNEAGEQFFRKHQMAMYRFEDSSGVRFGFTMKSLNLPWLKRMLLKGFVERIEIHVLDIAQTNEILGDAVRLVFFSMFRTRINLSVLDHIYNSPMLRSWNRANPRRSIVPGVNISRGVLRGILAGMNDKVSLLQLELQQLISGRIYSAARKWDDKEKLELFIGELLKDLDPLIFFILAGSKHEDRTALLANIAARIIGFTDMVDVLDLASLLSIELASAAEKSAMLSVMVQQNLNDISKSLPQLKMLMKKSLFRGTTIVVSIPRYRPKDKGRLKFRFSFYNDAADVNTERRLMEDFTGRGGNFVKKKLDDFFRERNIYDDNGMRFYYLTMLRGLCDKHNIVMDSGISASGRSTITSLSFGF